MRKTGLLLALLGVGAIVACGSDKTGGADGAPAGPTLDAGPGTSSGAPGGGGDAGGPLAPVVKAVVLPPSPVDVVALEITIADPGGAADKLAMTVSLDGGVTWRPARWAIDPGDLVSAPEGTKHVVMWDSVKDVGFHHPLAAKLRVTAQGPGGTSAPLDVDTPSIDNLRARAKRVQSYVIDYGDWTPADVAFAKKHDLVIAHPTVSDLKRPFIADMQQGADPADPADDVIVICYVSVGEDLRTAGITDDEAKADGRFTGDGTGPRIDARGPNPATPSLAGLPIQGSPSNGGTGWASFYLDDNSVFLSSTHVGDGVPDRNSLFGGYFVNAGDPNWFPVVDAFQRDSDDGVCGLREVLTTTYGRALDCDGVFLDTIDTAEPNDYTDETSLNLSKFEWTAPGMSQLIAHVHDAYADRLVLQNRGLFFYDPRRPHFQFSPRGHIDFAFFESFRLDSNQFAPDIYPDNRYNFAPKLMAEANRPDGFTVLSLGYAEGTQQPGAADTLLGNGTVALDSLLEDIHVAQELTGFRHYLTNADVTLVNSFVRDHSNWNDVTPPAWTSTYNDHDDVPAIEATPRVGIQEVATGSKSLTVRWDVALDLHRVGYALYYQTMPFDFGADPGLKSATRVVLTPSMPASYQDGVGPTTYPYEMTVPGLTAGATYYLVIRAFDASPAHNEDANTTVLTGVPLP